MHVRAEEGHAMNPSDDTKSTALATSDEAQARRPYRAPRLTCVGTVRTLTLSGSTTTSGDPGTSKKPGL
jgi:hypothetical protein